MAKKETPHAGLSGEVGRMLTVEVPAAEVLPGYAPHCPDVCLDQRQARALLAVFVALKERTATLADGREVHHQAHALAWILERVADQL